MAVTELTPQTTTNRIVLNPSGALHADVPEMVPLGIYAPNAFDAGDLETDLFCTGAVQQVKYVYNKLGGDVIDIEITNGQVYSSYEQACVVYSKIMNMHQAENVLSNVLGSPTASFDSNGVVQAGVEGEVQPGDNLSLKYPKFDFSYARRVTEGISSETALGGTNPVYSASIDLIAGQQDYDLQQLMEEQANDPESDFYNEINGTQILIRKVYYRTKRASWNFYGHHGAGLRLLSGYGGYSTFADASTFEIIPVWENKLQAINYEDHIKTRTSDFSYEIVNNKLRLFPCPTPNTIDKMWIEFQVPADVWSDDTSGNMGIDGINNMNNLPFENLPYSSINQIGKQWIRDYSCALCKEMLGIVRSKFSSIPTPGGEVTLDGPAMVSAAKEEMDKLVQELKEVLDKLTYGKLMQSDAEVLEASKKIMDEVPHPIMVG